MLTYALDMAAVPGSRKKIKPATTKGNKSRAKAPAPPIATKGTKKSAAPRRTAAKTVKRVSGTRNSIGAATAGKARAGKRGGALAERQAHAAEVWNHLVALYPNAHCELDFTSPWELLVATILSAQCTDKRVNMVTPLLFQRYPTPAAMASASAEDIEPIIRSTGFFRSKTRSILGAATMIVAEHDGKVPESMEALVKLPGTGRKTANVVLGNAFHRNEGIVVDTHVLRLGRLLGLTKERDPVAVEQDLIPLFARDQWTMLSHLLIWHGRRICEARRPRCSQCSLAGICPSAAI